MTRPWILAVLLLIAPMAASAAATPDSRLTPRCGGPFQLCGYYDRQAKAERIPKRFEVAGRFSEGLAAVRIEGRYGFIDSTGRMVVAPRFQTAGAFAHGYAEVRLEGASGIIDRSGRLVVPARFARIVPFHQDSFVAMPLREGDPRLAGEGEPLDEFSEPFRSPSLGRAGLYHLRKGWLTSQDLEFAPFDASECGLIWAGRRNSHQDEEWGLLRSDGRWQVSPRYNRVQQLVETRAVVTSMPDYSGHPTQGRSIRWGAVDRDGKLVVPLKFAYLSYWRGGYGLAGDGKPYGTDGRPREYREGIVRDDGSLLAGRYFDKVEFREGVLPRARLGKAWYSIAPDGRLLPDQSGGRRSVVCPSGLTLIEQGDRIEFRRKDGTSIGRFDKEYAYPRPCGPSYPVTRDGRGYIILADGTLLGGKQGFEDSYALAGGHAAVKVDGKWGIIAPSGAFTVKPLFASLHPDRNGTFAVDRGEGTYWIDAGGKRVAKPAAPRPDPNLALVCPGGLRFFQNAGYWGFRDGDGKTVIEPRYRALSCFQQGIAWTAALGGHSWCPIGPDGKARDALECRETFYPLFGHDSPGPEQFSDDEYENSVRWTRAYLDYLAGHRAEPPDWSGPRFAHGLRGWASRKLGITSTSVRYATPPFIAFLALLAAWALRRRKKLPSA